MGIKQKAEGISMEIYYQLQCILQQTGWALCGLAPASELRLSHHEVTAAPELVTAA